MHAKQLSVVAIAMVSLLAGCGTGNSNHGPQTTTEVASLSASDVAMVVQAAAVSVSDPIVVAVVDRLGNVLATYQQTGAPATATGNFSKQAPATDVAVALARTAAFFSNDQAPLSSRTVRFLSGIHFPPGVAYTPNAALYGIETTNRACQIDPTLTPGVTVPLESALGIITGKADVYDSDPAAVNPGGIPLFKDNELVGGVGVVGSTPAISEYAAFMGAKNANFIPAVPSPGAVVINGITLPFVLQTNPPDGMGQGTFSPGNFTAGPMASAGPAPSGYLLAPHAGPLGGLSASDVNGIVADAVATANQTRAMIRLPLGQRTRMVVAVADLDGSLLALYRMPDATMFSTDVAVSKARSMTYFNSGALVLSDLPGVPVGTAVTNRTISFGAQPLYPPGIDGSQPGPFFGLYQYDVLHPCTQGQQPSAGNQQSGIVFFPGSVGLYKNGVLVGGLGVSGDGVDQDDYVTGGGAVGFEAPTAIRADQIIDQGVRLPYLKFPRNPTQ